MARQSRRPRQDRAIKFGTVTYRAGALERIKDAHVLTNQRRLALSVYSAGCAVEGMLRAMIAIRSREFDERHDLRKLATRVRDLGLLGDEREHDFVGDVQGVARLWSNRLRFADEGTLKRFFSGVGEVKRGSTLKGAVEDYWERCSHVVRRCNVQWKRLHK